VKNQYFGDRNDYFKYDLAIFLSEQLTGIKRFTFIPMLTANDGGGDGGLIDYRQGAGRPDLYQFLKDKLKKRQRKVSHLQEYFKTNGLQFRYCPHGDTLDKEFTNNGREGYFKEIKQGHLRNALVLLDPDNGLEVKSAGPKTLHKYVKYNEAKLIYDRMDEKSVLLIYQHLPFLPRPMFIYSLIAKLQEELKSPIPLSVSDGRVAFILIAKTKDRQQELKDVVRDYLRLNLTLYD